MLPPLHNFHERWKFNTLLHSACMALEQAWRGNSLWLTQSPLFWSRSMCKVYWGWSLLALKFENFHLVGTHRPENS